VPAPDRETQAVPADWRRSAWCLFVGCIGTIGVATSYAAVSSAGLAFGAGMLLIGWAMGLSDHILANEQQRLTTRVRSWLSRDHDPRA